jgi:hypothetical protein
MKSYLQSNQPLITKREAQRLRKEYSVVEMYYLQKKKRGVIAKALRLSPDEVTKIIEKFKKDLGRVVDKLASDEQLAHASANYD